MNKWKEFVYSLFAIMFSKSTRREEHRELIRTRKKLERMVEENRHLRDKIHRLENYKF